MSQRRTLNSLAFPQDVTLGNLPVEWAADVSKRVLEWTWASFDRLKARTLAGIDLTVPIEQLERALTQHHYVELQILISEETDGYCSFVAVHECDEFEKLTSATAKPPSNDIGFMHRTHRRWVWPIEAKVVPTVNTLASYLTDVEKFKNGLAAPLIGEGAVIAYLLRGTSVEFFRNLLEHVTPLDSVDGFPEDMHRCSRHDRVGIPTIRLHHLAMSCN